MSSTENLSRKSIGSARNPESHEAILEAAEDVFCEAGYAGFSIEAVARRARAGKPTIYRWWPSKAHLLLDVYTRLKASRMPEPDTGTLEGDIRTFLTELARFWVGNTGNTGGVYKSLIAEAQADARAAEALQAYSKERTEHTAKMFDRAKARGEMRADADSLAASDLLSAYAWKLLLTDRLENAADAIDKVTAILVRGLLK
jgi:AcrR family transcriptional regulator